MQYLCLIYEDEKAWQKMTPAESERAIGEYHAYTQSITQSGHYVGGNALQPTHTATTVRVRQGKVGTTDGPFAETKEMLGGILILEAKDKAEAVAIISRHPGIRIGPFEVRPANEAFMAQHPILKKQ